MEQQTGSKQEKEYVKAVYCHPANIYAEYIMRNTGLEEAQAGIKTAQRNINNLRYADDATQPSHPLLSPSPPALNLSQHQGLFQ